MTKTTVLVASAVLVLAGGACGGGGGAGGKGGASAKGGGGGSAGASGRGGGAGGGGMAGTGAGGISGMGGGGGGGGSVVGSGGGAANGGAGGSAGAAGGGAGGSGGGGDAGGSAGASAKGGTGGTAGAASGGNSGAGGASGGGVAGSGGTGGGGGTAGGGGTSSGGGTAGGSGGVGGAAGAPTCTNGTVTFNDDFGAGLRTQAWTVTQTTNGLFTVDATQGNVQLTKVGANTTGLLQNVAVNLNLAPLGGSIAGDFDYSVSFSNVVLGSGGVDQVELHAHFADSSYFFDVYDNSDAGTNVHVWNGSINGRMAGTHASGTFRIARVGTTVSGYLDSTLIYSQSSASPLTAVEFILQLQPGSNDNVSVTYDNFKFAAACSGGSGGAGGGGGSGGAGGSAGSGGGMACLGNVTDDFSSGTLAPLWQDVSQAGCSATESAGKLVFTKGTGTTIAAAQTDASHGTICGDFDITVDYALDSWPAASSDGGRFHGISVVDVSGQHYLAGIQRYSQSNACVAGTSWYKAWLDTPSCPPNATYIPTTDTQGRFRIVRIGTQITTYYGVGSGWAPAMSGAATTAPVLVLFQSGTNGTLATPHTGSFDNFAVSAPAPGWVLVRIDDCSGSDRAIGYSTSNDVPVDADCTHAENGLAAVCWDQTTYHNELIPGTAPGCTYKTISAATCTGGTRPGYLYVCNRP